MIPGADEDGLITRVADGLIHEDFPTSYALIIPPSFNEDRLSDAIVARLRGEKRSPLIACITIDHIEKPLEYVQALQRQWKIGSPPKRGANTVSALMELVHAASQMRPVVQIVRRFQKFLEVMDPSVLGALRTLEADCRLRSAVCTPFPYSDVKQRWIEQGKKLIVSNYGDTHSTEIIHPLDALEAMRACVRHGVDEHVARFIVDQSGGYPEVCEFLIGTWQRSNPGRALTWVVKHQLAELAQKQLARFIEMLDLPDACTYREAVVALHHGNRTEQGLTTLARHPWAATLLDGEELRAAALGPAAAALVGGPHSSRVETARDLYRRAQYRQVRAALGPEPAATASERLLALHAEAMTLLLDPDDGAPGLDTDWPRLGKVLKEATELLANTSSVSSETIQRVREAQDRLRSPTEAIAKVQRSGDRRVVDQLALEEPWGAFWLLTLEAKRASAIVRHSAAVQAALALPEQIFRVWASWTLGLDEKMQPSDEAVWADVKLRWTVDFTPKPGEPFPSFDAFAWFALVSAERAQVPITARPEAGSKALERALSQRQLRRDKAHAVSRCSEHDRNEFFRLIERWMGALLPSCRAHDKAWSISEFEELVRPLPLLDARGAIEWM